MVSSASRSRSRRPVPAWHEKFIAMLPAIVRHARISFRALGPEARQEAIQEAVCNACAATARLAELGKLDLAYASVLGRFAVAQVRDGRKVGDKLNCRDILSPYCQRLKHLTIERLDRFDEEENAWAEAVVEDTRTATVPDIVAFRCDFADWLRSLRRRDRRIAETLALGNRTGAVAKRFKLSEGRVRNSAASWPSRGGLSWANYRPAMARRRSPESSQTPHLLYFRPCRQPAIGPPRRDTNGTVLQLPGGPGTSRPAISTKRPSSPQGLQRACWGPS